MAHGLVTKLSISKVQIKAVDAHLEDVRHTKELDTPPTRFTTLSPLY